MKNLEELKYKIESRSVSDEMIIFKISDTDFICTQYIKAISEIRHLEIEYVDSLTFLIPNSLFDNVSDTLKVFRCDSIEEENIPYKTDLIIITKKISDKYIDYTYEVPKLEDWQIKDYAYSLLENIKHKDLDYLISICKDIYRIDNELSKLTIFSDKHQELFNQFISDDVFSDLSNYTVFDLTNALLKKDVPKVNLILKELQNIDVEPIGLVTILINSFRDVISIQFDPRMTAEELGIAKNRFWAIKRNCGFYPNTRLIKIFYMLNTIDFRLKVGDLPASMIIDYVITNILGDS